ncbi:TPA: class IIb bacteriocin, lactobin A/cerein 7B family [Streptococcus suis]|uniref:Class IIb bacteriocin, lactobin A/cerein 7B family n=1 Tax=Streptococcus suis TaxID=1307 RepID=A0A3R8R5K4_STRSU|nr:class IIb bacteriocin, lactobin A/cerein 7B family [Streptococcus suis]NQM49669.1 class IIb bacteriocin, lactobin A/cerein 7B family [Streptococcus suis]RRR43224.1 class IIb bacteriocin, lactobin A/cerein 7B family [Streptococcus suis]UUM58881.1 class IIb bacteriocin, lactobin A/cerein 7B family [Streptococcus suis]UUM63111.1 class IIb bacteriocin, lactobin A/cerein 7B family [Streptococcus suis]HEL1551528.1 class IIb bacteriocin, lactobin A/cerein 7B family [Streptococcus suis]
MTEFNTLNKQFTVLSEEELLGVDGGIEPVTAGLIVLGLVYGSGVFVGFMGG